MFLERPERLELPTYWFEAGEGRKISKLRRRSALLAGWRFRGVPLIDEQRGLGLPCRGLAYYWAYRTIRVARLKKLSGMSAVGAWNSLTRIKIGKRVGPTLNGLSISLVESLL